jgi:hypothetical protein
MVGEVDVTSMQKKCWKEKDWGGRGTDVDGWDDISMTHSVQSHPPLRWQHVTTTTLGNLRYLSVPIVSLHAASALCSHALHPDRLQMHGKE